MPDEPDRNPVSEKNERRRRPKPWQLVPEAEAKMRGPRGPKKRCNFDGPSGMCDQCMNSIDDDAETPEDGMSPLCAECMERRNQEI